MLILVTAEFVSAFSLAVSLLGLCGLKQKRTSTRALVICCIVQLFWIYFDAASYLTLDKGCPDFILYIVNYVAYVIGSFAFITFAVYCKKLTDEYLYVNKWIFYTPVLLMSVSVCIITFNYLAGNVVRFEDGICVMNRGMPVVCIAIHLFCMLYFLIIAINKRRKTGYRIVVLLGVYGGLPLTTTIAFLINGKYDYTPVGAALATMVICMLIHTRLSIEMENKYKNLLEAKNYELVSVNEEQEAQIEEIKELNRQLEESAANLEQANAAKTSFLFNMSHDIRTPMNAIMGYTNLLEKYHDDEAKFQDYMSKIRSSSEVLLSLINNVLEMARIDSGKDILDESVIKTSTMGNDIAGIYVELMKEKKLELVQDVDIKSEYVMVDRVKINEIFLNLISNAFKYTPSGGKISVTVRELPDERPDYIRLQTTISDTGIGMSKDYLPKLYEEFTREKNATEAGIQGTGLGMPIVKKLIDLMNGEITVESEVGKGTTFVVTIPHRKAEKPVVEVTDDEVLNANHFAGKKILLAEDNDLNAEIAVEILQDVGFEVERVEDGVICVDAISKAEAGQYDLILMDVQMPNMDGYKATQAIRALNDTEKAAIPIIAMTANAYESDRQNAISAGMNDHISKPIEVVKLLNVLKKYVGSSENTQSIEDVFAKRKSVEKKIAKMKNDPFLSMLPGGFFAYEADGEERLIYANEEACMIWGCNSFEELMEYCKGSFIGMVHPDDYEQIESSIRNQINIDGKNDDRVVYRIIRKDGTVRWVDDYGRLERDVDSGDIFYVFIADTTEKHSKMQIQ